MPFLPPNQQRQSTEAGTRTVKTILDLNEARDDGVWGWQSHHLDHIQSAPCSGQMTTPTPHQSFLHAGLGLPPFHFLNPA